MFNTIGMMGKETAPGTSKLPDSMGIVNPLPMKQEAWVIVIWLAQIVKEKKSENPKMANRINPGFIPWIIEVQMDIVMA